jgi:hypothetical protein
MPPHLVVCAAAACHPLTERCRSRESQVEAVLRSESPIAAKLRSYQGKPLPQHERAPTARSGCSGVSELARESETLLGAIDSAAAAPLVSSTLLHRGCQS